MTAAAARIGDEVGTLRHPDPSVFKARILAAYEAGELTAEEAESWIVLNGLGEA